MSRSLMVTPASRACTTDACTNSWLGNGIDVIACVVGETSRQAAPDYPDGRAADNRKPVSPAVPPAHQGFRGGIFLIPLPAGEFVTCWQSGFNMTV